MSDKKYEDFGKRIAEKFMDFGKKKDKDIHISFSFGGNTKGLQIPYTIHWIGERTYGTASISDGAMTFQKAGG